jgi:hypothetical protein
MHKERQVIKDILAVLYREHDYDKDEPIVNPDKEWDSDTASEIARILEDADYIPEHSVRLDPENQIAIVWDAEDVIGQAEMLFDGEFYPSRKEAREIIEKMDRYHDCNYGISWETINYYLHELKDEKEAAEEG